MQNKYDVTSSPINTPMQVKNCPFVYTSSWTERKLACLTMSNLCMEWTIFWIVFICASTCWNASSNFKEQNFFFSYRNLKPNIICACSNKKMTKPATDYLNVSFCTSNITACSPRLLRNVKVNQKGGRCQDNWVNFSHHGDVNAKDHASTSPWQHVSCSSNANPIIMHHCHCPTVLCYCLWPSLHSTKVRYSDKPYLFTQSHNLSFQEMKICE